MDKKQSDGPYTMKESGEKFGGFMGYVVEGPGIVNDGDDMEHGLAKQQVKYMNFAWQQAMAQQRAASGEVARLSEQVASLKRLRGSRARRAENVPDGYEEIEAWTNGREVVVLGDAPDEESPEAELHNCDALGCSAFGPHVIHRAAITPQETKP